MKFKVLLVCAVLIASQAGCRKKAAAPVVNLEPLPPQPAAKSADGTPIIGNESEMANSNATLLTSILQEFIARNGRMPSDLKELSTITTFGAIPRPPAGYRFEIDQKRKIVVPVKQ